MTTSKPKNEATKPFVEKFKEQLQTWSPKKKKRFAFFIFGLVALLCFTQFAIGIRNTYRMFRDEQHFLVTADSAAVDSTAIRNMLNAADSIEQTEKIRLDSLLEDGLIQTILSK